MQRSSLRLAALITVGLLLIPAGLGQAAPPPDQQSQSKATLNEPATPAATAPSRDDQDLINLGGYSAVDGYRAKAPAAKAAAEALAAAPAKAAPVTAPLQLNTAARTPAPATPAAIKWTGATATRTAATSAPQAQVLRTNSSRSAGTVHTEGTYAGYTLQVAQDTFYFRDPIDTTVTLTLNGTPVPNAWVWAGNQGPFTTDTIGVAHITLPALNRWEVMSLSIEAPDHSWKYHNLAELYVRQDDMLVTVVDQVTDQSGQPVQGFDANFYDAYGTAWGRGTNTGAVGVVTKAADMYTEVLPWGQPGNLLITGDVPQGTDVRRALHPSGSSAGPVNVTATLDGATINGNVTMHLAGRPGTSYPQNLGMNFAATPGTYNMVLSAGTDTESILLSRPGVAVTPAAPANVTFTETRQGLAAINLLARDGNNNIVNFKDARFALGDAMGRADGHAGLIRLTPGTTILDEYTVSQSSLDGWWDFGFNGRDGSRGPLLLSAGPSPTDMNIGGHINATIQPGQQTCQGSPCNIPLQVRLQTPGGDLLNRVELQGNRVMGWVRLYKLTNGSYNLVSEQNFEPGWGNGRPDVWVNLPAEANGIYKASLEMDLGPYQGLVTTESTFTITDPAAYQVSISPRQLAPNSTQTVTVQVSNLGAPVTGQLLKLGHGSQYGESTTDATGTATFTVKTNNNREAIPLFVPGEGRDIRLDNVYVVPAGYSLITIMEVRDQNNVPVRNFKVGAAWYDPNDSNQWDTHEDWTETGTIGVVRPAGINDLDVWTDNEAPAVYHYQKVDVTGPFSITMGGGGIAMSHLTATATVNGQSAAGRLVLHNRAKTGPTQTGSTLPPDVWVTPGQYDVVFESDAAATKAILLQENVDLNADNAVTFNPGALAWLQSVVSDKDGNSLGNQGWDRLDMGNFRLNVDKGINHAVMPGVPLKVSQFERYVFIPVGTKVESEYRFNNEDGTAPAPLQPGQTLQVFAGGPLQPLFQPAEYPPQPGRDYQVKLGLYDGHGNRVQPMQWWSDLPGHIWLDNPAHDPVWQRDFGPWDRDVWIPIPGDAAGDYTIGADWNGGVAFNSPGAQVSIHVEPAIWLNVTVMPQVLQPDQTTQVTITVTHNGAPYTDVNIWMPSKGQMRPDANGQIITDVTMPGGTAWPVEARNAANTLVGKTNLFGLWPEEAGVELTATDNSGKWLAAIWGSAEPVADRDKRRTEFTENGPVGLVVPAGETDLQVTTEGRDLYLIGSHATLAGGQVAHLTLDGGQTVTATLSANLDGQPLENGNIGLRRQGNMGPSWLRGLDLDQSGQGTVHVTPDSYETVVSWHRNTTHYINSFGILPYGNNDNKVFNLQQSNLSSLSFSAITGAGPQCPGVSLKTGGVQVWAQPACTVMASPGTYGLDTLRYSLQQATGPTLEYTTRRDQPVMINVMLNQQQHFTYDMAITDVSTEVTPNPYRAGDWLHYRLNLGAADGWILRDVEDQETRNRMAPQTIELRDAAGNLMPIGYDQFGEWNGWPVPNQNPSSSYTVTISRDLGALGQYSASATTKLRTMSKYRFALDKEILPVGQQTAVNLTLTADNLPVANARITVYGETMQEKVTDGRGHVVIAAKPSWVDVWVIEYRPEGGDPIRTYLYAIDSRYGVLSAKPKDAAGKPFAWFSTNTGDSLYGEASCNGPDCRKMIVPVGPTSLVVRGRDQSMNRYYMVAQANVKPLAVTIAMADATNTVPLSLNLANQMAGTDAAVALHTTAVKYRENLWYRMDQPLFVSPGTYDASVVAFAGRTAYVLPAPFTAPVTGTATVSADMAAATGTIQTSFQLPDGSPSPNGYTFYIGGTSGLFYDFLSADTDRVMVVPGAWTAEGYTVTLGYGTEQWEYQFSGSVPLNVSAGQTVQVDMGGPLTGVAEATQQPALVNGTALLRGVARDAHGFTLGSIRVFDAADGRYLRSFANELSILGPGGYALNVQYEGDLFKWMVPGMPGTYTLKFTRYIGPYSQTAPQGPGTVQVIRLTR